MYKDVVVNMDTTYWSRGFGLMVIKDTFRNRILWYRFVRHETVAGYMEGVEELRSLGFRIHGVVCDGLRGLFSALKAYRVQMCQFHQMMIVRRYLTRHPELPASMELLEISNMLTYTDRDSFIRMMDGEMGRFPKGAQYRQQGQDALYPQEAEERISEPEKEHAVAVDFPGLSRTAYPEYEQCA